MTDESKEVLAGAVGVQIEIERCAKALAANLEHVRELAKANEELGAAFSQSRRQAFEADSGLEGAWRKAQERDSTIGWLDVAVTR